MCSTMTVHWDVNPHKSDLHCNNALQVDAPLSSVGTAQPLMVPLHMLPQPAVRAGHQPGRRVPDQLGLPCRPTAMSAEQFALKEAREAAMRELAEWQEQETLLAKAIVREEGSLEELLAQQAQLSQGVQDLERQQVRARPAGGPPLGASGALCG